MAPLFIRTVKLYTLLWCFFNYTVLCDSRFIPFIGKYNPTACTNTFCLLDIDVFCSKYTINYNSILLSPVNNIRKIARPHVFCCVYPEPCHTHLQHDIQVLNDDITRVVVIVGSEVEIVQALEVAVADVFCIVVV